jgi:hypothetical protein
MTNTRMEYKHTHATTTRAVKKLRACNLSDFELGAYTRSASQIPTSKLICWVNPESPGFTYLEYWGPRIVFKPESLRNVAFVDSNQLRHTSVLLTAPFICGYMCASTYWNQLLHVLALSQLPTALRCSSLLSLPMRWMCAWYMCLICIPYMICMDYKKQIPMEGAEEQGHYIRLHPRGRNRGRLPVCVAQVSTKCLNYMPCACASRLPWGYVRV